MISKSQRNQWLQGPDKWAVHSLYKSLNRVPETKVLQSLEQLIRKKHLYDFLEFSQKYAKTNGRYCCNPSRFSLYTSDCRPNSSFLTTGFNFFKETLKGTKGAKKLKDLQSSYLQFERTDLRFRILSIEINAEKEKTRLKTYGGYWSNPQVRQLIRRIELDFNGKMATAKYHFWPISDARAKFWVKNLPLKVSIHCFSAIFVQGDCLDFMINPKNESAWKEVRLMMPSRSIKDRLTLMCKNGFHLFVMRLHRSEIRKNDLRNLSLYFRYY